MIAEPIIRDYTVPQGVTYQIKMRWTDSAGAPISLVGALVRAQLRLSFDDANPALDCTIANTKAFLLTNGWYFGFNLLPADTLSINATSYVYDLLVTTADGDVTRAMQGKISLTPSVTRNG